MTEKSLITTATLKRIVQHYIKTRRGSARRELNEFADQPSLVEAVKLAARCIDVLRAKQDGKTVRHSHQRRITRQSLIKAERSLLSVIGELQKSRSFEELHHRVEAVIGGRGIGALTVYDIAQRIGAYLKLRPKLVYLHAGTADGARHLGVRGRVVKKGALPKEFGHLHPSEIEDCLCIYKDVLSRKNPLSSLSAGSCGPVGSGCMTIGRPIRKC